jgi:hypothetical protein
MQNPVVAFWSALGLISCIALIFVASRLPMRWTRIVVSLIAIFGLFAQGLFWGHITLMLMQLNVGGTYLWLYAALLVCLIGMTWALVVLVLSIFGRHAPG